MNDIVQRILTEAKRKGLAQKELALALGISPQIITDWKKGNTTSYTRYITQISGLLDVSTEYLLTGQLPTSVTLDGVPEYAAALAKYEKLSPERRIAALAYMDFLIAQQE